VGGICDLSNVVIWEDYTGRGLNVGGEDYTWFFTENFLDNSLDIGRFVQSFTLPIGDFLSFYYGGGRCYTTCVENLGPPVTEITVSNNKNVFFLSELSSDRFHAGGS
jgi:hypothetical protein